MWLAALYLQYKTIWAFVKHFKSHKCYKDFLCSFVETKVAQKTNQE